MADSGIQAILNDLKTLGEAVLGDSAAKARIDRAYSDVSDTISGVVNTLAGTTETVAGINSSIQASYNQFQIVSTGWSAFKLEGTTLPEWLKDRESRLATGGTTGRLGRFGPISDGLKVKEAAAKKLDDVWLAVFPGGFGTTSRVAELSEQVVLEKKLVTASFEAADGEISGIKTGLARMKTSLETNLGHLQKDMYDQRYTKNKAPQKKQTPDLTAKEMKDLEKTIKDLAAAIG